MKVFINTITNTQLAEIQLQQAKDGVPEKDRFTGTYDIKGELFIPSEWKHVADTFEIDAKLYPYIKEVSIYLEEETKRVLTENGLNNFSRGVKESYELYAKAVPPVATDILKYAPAAVSVEPMIEEGAEIVIERV